jgi:hypothetical protein
MLCRRKKEVVFSQKNPFRKFNLKKCCIRKSNIQIFILAVGSHQPLEGFALVVQSFHNISEADRSLKSFYLSPKKNPQISKGNRKIAF